LSILKVLDRDGNVLEENLPKAKEVMKARNAAMISNMLKIAVERGTGARARIKGYAIAGKTGTTNDYVDAWFNGFSPDLVTVVQFGFDQPKSLGPRKAGGSVAGPVWKAFMEKALKHYPQKDFPMPGGTVKCRVCMTSGKLASKSCPGREVVSQIFPVESQPLTECKHYQLFDNYASGGEVVDGFVSASASMLPDNNFFRGDYQSNSGVQQSASSNDSNVNPTAGWIPRENPNPDQSILKKWGADQAIPPDAFLDPGLADAPAVEHNSTPREPGVFVEPPPSVQFRDDYN
jgi:membrane carboxypeptidase/penicillin-binding protein